MIEQNIWFLSSLFTHRELSQSNEPPDPDIVAEESESRLLDTSGAEELSVKTLADMFDFRLGEQVNKKFLKAAFGKSMFINLQKK